MKKNNYNWLKISLIILLSAISSAITFFLLNKFIGTPKLELVKTDTIIVKNNNFFHKDTIIKTNIITYIPIKNDDSVFVKNIILQLEQQVQELKNNKDSLEKLNKFLTDLLATKIYSDSVYFNINNKEKDTLLIKYTAKIKRNNLDSIKLYYRLTNHYLAITNNYVTEKENILTLKAGSLVYINNTNQKSLMLYGGMDIKNLNIIGGLDFNKNYLIGVGYNFLIKKTNKKRN